jgi:hypothetical protein
MNAFGQRVGYISSLPDPIVINDTSDGLWAEGDNETYDTNKFGAKNVKELATYCSYQIKGRACSPLNNDPPGIDERCN